MNKLIAAPDTSDPDFPRVAHVAKTLVLAGVAEPKAQADAQLVMDIENQLALASRRPEELRNPLTNHNLMSVNSLQRLSPAFNWKGFLRAMDLTNVDRIDVGQPDFVKGLGHVLKDASPDALKAYLRWHMGTVKHGSSIVDPFRQGTGAR